MFKDDKYIVALDQGTTSSRAVIFNQHADVVSVAQKKITQIYPKPSWVEHDPMEILQSQLSTLHEALIQANIRYEQISAIGITNQRETCVVWNKKTGKPIYNAIVWQCRRSTAICQALAQDQQRVDYIHDNTGLVLDPYFSASKIKWILDNVKEAREQAERGELLLGTIDSWLLWNLTQGEVHATDYTNASRTMLFNIRTLQWDKQLLDWFSIPESMLPEPLPSSSFYGKAIFSESQTQIPVMGIAGDQQSALFGHLCIDYGMAKNTYGTGCFLLMNTGKIFVKSHHGLLTTLACSDKKTPCYALEGSVFIAGAGIQWLRDELKLIKDAKESEQRARQVANDHGVYLVPAFTGLGAPHWDPYARGLLIGLTRGTNADHIIRATLESIAFQTRDLLETMQAEAKVPLSLLRVDGGVTVNQFLMQYQADILGSKVECCEQHEITAQGAAFLAGLAIGYWQDIQQLRTLPQLKKTFLPRMKADERHRLYQGWQKAVSRCKNWLEE